MDLTRRRFTTLAGATGVASLAGCLTRGRSEQADGTIPIEPEYGSWFENVSNYDGTHDLRGREEVSVAVGVAGGMGYFKFGPAAIAVSPGTTVTWTWTGRGGAHDVRAENGTFRSGNPVDRKDYTFSHAFDAPGVYRYYCTPHRSMGMKGAVFVALDE